MSGSIYLYVLVISDGYQVPVFSMVSEKHDANFITFFLMEWLRNGGSVPNEFTVDMSLALLNAVARAFANYSSLNSYIDALFKYHISSNSSTSFTVPNVFIRIDLAHLMKCVVSFESLRGVRPKVKEFFVRCVAELIKETSFKNAENHIRKVLIVALSKTEGL